MSAKINKLIIINTDNNKQKDLNLDPSISQNSYFLGEYNEKLYFAEDVEKGDSVFNSSNIDILAHLNPKILLLELGYWNGVANLRNNKGEEIVL